MQRLSAVAGYVFVFPAVVLVRLGLVAAHVSAPGQLFLNAPSLS